jgi:site-specific DNA-methyltransferase (adenine-specific)
MANDALPASKRKRAHKNAPSGAKVSASAERESDDTRAATFLNDGLRPREVGESELRRGDALDFYHVWPRPTVIVSDGAYGITGFSSDVSDVGALWEWYEPHVRAWSERALPSTSLWFWNTEIGWATVHPLLEKHGWTYVHCNVWNKGKGHIAGNCNTSTIRLFPVVTEVCALYTRKVAVRDSDGREVSVKRWLRDEWIRSGRPLSEANGACGVGSAATRKYLTKDHMWYPPPPEVFERLQKYANERRGDEERGPFYAPDGKKPLTAEDWTLVRAKFRCPYGTTNCWDVPTVRGTDRVKKDGVVVHLNQKPLELVEKILRATADPGDVAWEPFGGLCPVAVSSEKIGLRCFSAETDEAVHEAAERRLEEEAKKRETDRP